MPAALPIDLTDRQEPGFFRLVTCRAATKAVARVRRSGMGFYCAPANTILPTVAQSSSGLARWSRRLEAKSTTLALVWEG